MEEVRRNGVLRSVDLSIGYTHKKRNQVLAQKLNLDLYKGQLTCLVGRNGIGKSTLLRTLSGLQIPLGGHVKIDDLKLQQADQKALAQRLSLVLTDRLPPTNLTVFELIALGRHPYTNWLGVLTRKDIEAVELAIDRSQLRPLREKRCDELSDGQLQRVFICRALAQETDIIMLDEPTAHLDIQHKIETFHLLKEIASEMNKAVLISTHELQLAEQIADLFWMMTPEGIDCEPPDKLIKSGKINRLFETNSIYYDQERRQFRIS